MRPGGRALAVAAAFALAVAACGRGSKSSHHEQPPRRSTTTTASKHHATSTTAASTTTTTVAAPSRGGGSGGPTTTVPQTLLQALIADSRNADIKVVYDTPTGRITLIRRHGDSVYADQSGVDFTLGTANYECTGTGDGETCTRVSGDATLSDIDAYAGLVADALSVKSYTVDEFTSSILGRTAECVSIIGRAAARAGRSVSACVDDESGVLLRFGTLGAPDPGLKLWAVSVGAPTDADFQLPVPPT